MEQILSKSPEAEDFEFLLENKVAWIELLKTNHDYNASLLLENLDCFKPNASLYHLLKELIPILEMKAFHFSGGIITKEEFRKLLDYANHAPSLGSVDNCSINLTTSTFRAMRGIHGAPLGSIAFLFTVRFQKSYRTSLAICKAMAENNFLCDNGRTHEVKYVFIGKYGTNTNFIQVNQQDHNNT